MLMKTRFHVMRGPRSRSGGALVLVVFAVTTLALLALSVTTVSRSSTSEQMASNQQIQAQYDAEAGLGEALFDLSKSGTGNIGSPQAPAEFGGGTYWVETSDLGHGVKSLVSTSHSNNSSKRLQLVVKKQNTSIYRFGCFGDTGVTLASNARVDAFDSSLGSYASQAIYGSGSSAYAIADGDVGSNASILLKQNSKVWGDVIPGPSGTATIIGSATATGSTTPATTPQNMPAIAWPSLSSLGALTVVKNGTMDLPAGSYRYDTTLISTGATLNITGPATLVFDSLALSSNAKININAAAGPVKMYVQNNFVMSSNTLIASGTKRPADVSMFLNSDNILDPDGIVDLDQIDFNSNSQLYGTIYAPNASITVNSNFEVFGALIAKKVWLDSNSRIHFDEQLLNIPGSGPPVYSAVCFRVLAAG
jgi:hypothetical protein